jgi:hypothetical protein
VRWRKDAHRKEGASHLTDLPGFPFPKSCDSRVDVFLLCGVAVTREKAKGGEPVDDMPRVIISTST